jgi:hypothetical protein
MYNVYMRKNLLDLRSLQKNYSEDIPSLDY